MSSDAFCLHWCFVDSHALDYHAGSPEQIPLGGSQSALCFLARELAARGHRVTLVNFTRQPGLHHRVRCLNRDELAPDFWETAGIDLLVSLSEPSLPELPRACPRILWMHHNPGVTGVAEQLAQWQPFAAVVYVSHWQQQAFRHVYGLPAAEVIANACPPYYAPLLPDPQAFLAARPGPLTLAYTSTPFRGLKILLAIFPGLHQRFPQLRLKVYSSLRVYQAPQHEEDDFAPLYAECRSLPGVEYLGSVPQPELAAALRGVHILAYPSRYQETFCLAAVEAMAAGCQVVSSDLGALAETTAGRARLVPYHDDVHAFGLPYFEALSECLRRWQQEPDSLAQELLGHSRWTLDTYNQTLQADRWEALARRILTENPPKTAKGSR
ncbi:MAG: glycosyltransferase family 4 protein [Candidatus Sericytochromatia bacterium]